MKTKHARQLGALPTLLLLAAIFLPLVKVVSHFLYRLPEPLSEGCVPGAGRLVLQRHV
jgi:hypothetical protein